MATVRAKESGSFWTELLSRAIYKRNQGRVVRQATFIALAAIVFFGCSALSASFFTGVQNGLVRQGVPVLIGLVGLWIVFRLVNYPRFANFLIAVEGEMDKVSWADQAYLVRATIVVIVTMVLMGLYLWLCDTIWVWFFTLIGFRERPPVE